MGRKNVKHNKLSLKCCYWRLLINLFFTFAFRATAQTVRCHPHLSPALPVADDLYRKLQPALALTSPTPPSCVAHKPPLVKMRMNRAALRPWGGASPHGRAKRESQGRGKARPPGAHPHLDATLLSPSWLCKRTTTAQTPLVPWKRWPSRRPWPAAWDAQTPSARPVHARGLAGKSPTDTFESVWHRQPQSLVVTL